MYPHLHLLMDASANDSHVIHSQTYSNPANIIAIIINLCHIAISAAAIVPSVTLAIITFA